MPSRIASTAAIEPPAMPADAMCMAGNGGQSPGPMPAIGGRRWSSEKVPDDMDVGRVVESLERMVGGRARREEAGRAGRRSRSIPGPNRRGVRDDVPPKSYACVDRSVDDQRLGQPAAGSQPTARVAS